MTRLQGSAPDLPQLAPRDPLVGSLLQGRYRVLHRIGKGGMGVVYLAEHVLIRRKVAIKTLHANPAPAPAVVERFHREALAATAVGDQHVVDVTDMGLLDDGAYYIVMEYLEGADLAWTVASEGRLPIARAVRIASQLCDALTAVHAAGIVHRDLKPENLFLIERGGDRDFVKVLDFGVCKLTQTHEGSYHRLTGTGAALGTPHFMAPEQIEGRPDVDLRADLYAVGGILFHALTGDAPFDAPSLPRLFMRICSDPPPSLLELRPEAPEGLAAVVAKTLAKEPADRYASSAELKEALAPFLNVEQAAAVTQPECAPAERAGAAQGGQVTDVEWVTLEGRRKWPLRLVLVGAVIALAVIGIGVWGGARSVAKSASVSEPKAASESESVSESESESESVSESESESESESDRGVTATAGPAAADSAVGAKAAGARGMRKHAVQPAAPLEPPTANVDVAPATPAASIAPATPAEPEPLLPQRGLKHVF